MPCHNADEMLNPVIHLQLLPFGFCLLPFAFVRSTLPALPGASAARQKMEDAAL